MNVLRRRFFQDALAVAASPTRMFAMPHVVLLGDSVFDHGAYTGGKPTVLAQLLHALPRGWKASMLARDGATTGGMRAQLALLPADATVLVLSVGGNDALMRQGLLQAPAASVAEAIDMLAEAVREFESAYRDVIGASLRHRLPLVVCTIYNGNFDDPRYRRLTRTAVALFDDAILRTAAECKLKVIELRLICTRPEDYANTIEPSSIGAGKIARAIAAAVTAAPDGKNACFVSGHHV
ncbi:MAG: SGNH/GDSL hydrolase family protein [Pseudomonadota bacterium]